MKKFIYLMLLAFIPLLAIADSWIVGATDEAIYVNNGDVVTLVASPTGSEYTYDWDYGHNENPSAFNVSVNENQLTLTARQETGIIEVTCYVYGTNGNVVSSYYWEVIIIP